MKYLDRSLPACINPALNLTLIFLAALLLHGCKKQVGFEAHLDEAIELYEHRKDIYSAISQGKSDTLFFTLITTEKLLKPLARGYDWRANRFNNQGIAIIEADFVSMDNVFEPEKPLPPAVAFTAEDQSFIKQVMESFHPFKDSQNFIGLAEHAVHTLELIELYEQEKQIYFQMLKHVVESIGFGALHAHQYHCESNGETDILANDFLNLQITGLNELIIFLDRKANELHQMGIGVLVNDLPTIPVVVEFEEYQQSGPACGLQ